MRVRQQWADGAFDCRMEILSDDYKVKVRYTKENKKMQELNSIMRDLLEVEYNQESLLFLLGAAEAVCSEKEQKEAKFIANSTKYYLSSLQRELKMAINKLDSYIAENVKKR